MQWVDALATKLVLFRAGKIDGEELALFLLAAIKRVVPDLVIHPPEGPIPGGWPDERG